VLEHVARQLVDGGELGEVAGVRARGAEDEVDLLPEGARAEEEDHDEGVREAHLGAVDGAVARSLHDGQQVMVRRVEDHPLDGGLVGLKLMLTASIILLTMRNCILLIS
jgi:hypothetical protein